MHRLRVKILDRAILFTHKASFNRFELRSSVATVPVRMLSIRAIVLIIVESELVIDLEVVNPTASYLSVHERDLTFALQSLKSRPLLEAHLEHEREHENSR